MVCIDQNRDFCAFEVRLASKTMHDCQEFMVVDGVILLSGCEFLGVKSHCSLWSRFVCAIYSFGWGVTLVKDGTCSDLGGIDLKLKLP